LRTSPKFSPKDGAIEVEVSMECDAALLEVRDHRQSIVREDVGP
jgi:hypothetical protein